MTKFSDTSESTRSTSQAARDSQVRYLQAFSSTLACLLVLTGTTFCSAQRNLKDIPDPDTGLQLAELEVAPEFEINLFAADPRIAKPIQMNFDPAGRLWIASSEVYPQIEPGKPATDKILVLEDQDHNGTADTTTVFAEGLLIPTGVVPGDGGAYVANSTELLHFADTNGDGVADTERVMLSGFGTEDTHHILHTLRWGPEGLLYMNQSIYIHSHIETPHGVRRMNGGGTWHFRPETFELETFALGLVNPWGHAFDKFGQSFATDGAGGEGINYIFPGFVGITSPGAKRIMHGLNPGKPKLCGLEMIGGSHLPDDWQGDLIANDFRAHRVCRYKISENEAGYASQELGELVKTRHQAFRPIDVKLGPDGAIYIADWYNPIIQHGEVDFRDPRRDHTHGRIWRVSAKNRPTLPYKNLYNESTATLLKMIGGNEPFWRDQAKRVLKERGGDEVLPLVRQALGEDASAGKLSSRHKLEMLWLYQAFDVVNEDLLGKMLAAQDARIRAAATRVLYHWSDRVMDPISLLAKSADDDHPRVRMEAAHVVRKTNTPAATEVMLRSIQKENDKYLQYALQQTADRTQATWIPALRAGELNVGQNSAGLLFALQAADTADAVPLALQASAAWQDDAVATREVMQMVAARGNARELADVLERAVAAGTPNALRVSLLQALSMAASQRKLEPTAELNQINGLFESSSEAVRAGAIRLAGQWGMADHAERFANIAGSNDVSPQLCDAATVALSLLGDTARLQKLNNDSASASTRIAAVIGMVRIDSRIGAESAAGLLPKLGETDGPERLIQAFLAQKGGDSNLTSAIKTQKPNIQSDVAKLCIRIARSSGRDVQTLVEAITAAGNLSDSAKPLDAEQRTRLLADALTSGDPVRGESVYRRKELNCQKCHGIGGAGGKVGPDLASIGASAPADYVLESLLDPGAKIKENYHSLVLATEEGQILTGVKLRETEDALILRDAEDKQISIPLDAIIDKKDGGSLMPSGLLNDLTRQETLDLVRFLTELGKVGEFALPQTSFVRNWQTLSSHQGNGQTKTIREADVAKSIATKSGSYMWEPVYSRVDGSLPLGELPRHVSAAGDEIVYVRFRLDIPGTTPRIRNFETDLGVNGSIYLGGTKVAENKQTKRMNLQASLPPGQHWIMCAVQPTAGQQVVRVADITP